MTGVIPWAMGREAATILSTPAPEPGSPPVATLIRPAGNLKRKHKSYGSASIRLALLQYSTYYYGRNFSAISNIA